MAITRIGLRTLQNLLRKRGYNTRGYAIVGISELAFRLAENIENAPEMGLKLKGFFDDREGRTPKPDPRVGQRMGKPRRARGSSASRRSESDLYRFSDAGRGTDSQCT